MTLTEFMNIRIGGGDKVKYDGGIYLIYRTDFQEALFAINTCDDLDNLSWVRCENCEFISSDNSVVQLIN